MYSMWIICNSCVVIFVYILDVTMSYQSYKEKEFLKKLTENYDPLVRPVLDTSEELRIGVHFGLLSLVGVDEKKEMLSCRGWVTMAWVDSYLKWNSTRNTPERLYIPVTEIWTPTLLLVNSLNDVTYLHGKGEKAIMSHKGNVTVSFYEKFETQCKVNIGKFPFDRQRCEIIVAPAHSVSVLSGEYVHPMHSTALLNMYEENGEWALADTSVKARDSGFSGINLTQVALTLTLDRRTSFYILNNILPVVFLSSLNTFAFLLPEDSGEKMSLCVSILVSYAVFLTLINSYLPENSDNICFFSVYLTVLVLISTLICLATLFILALYSRLQKGRNVPKWLNIFTRNHKVDSNDVISTGGQVDNIVKDIIISSCNNLAFWFFFTLTMLSNLMFFVAVSV